MILCCGEALIDMLPRETTLGEKAFRPMLAVPSSTPALHLDDWALPPASSPAFPMT